MRLEEKIEKFNGRQGINLKYLYKTNRGKCKIMLKHYRNYNKNTKTYRVFYSESNERYDKNNIVKILRKTKLCDDIIGTIINYIPIDSFPKYSINFNEHYCKYIR